MEVVIDSEDLKRLKSREEKYLAYMEMLSYWWEDKTEVEALLWKIVELKEERDKWRGKYNRLKSEFNLLKNKIWTTQK